MKTLAFALLLLVSAQQVRANNTTQEPPTLWKIFTVTSCGNDVVINWVTITEMSAVTYYVQHSKDGLHWECIDTIVTENKSFTGTEFRFLHRNPGSGDHYYRVITIDQVQFEESSPIRKITQEMGTGSFRVIENPVSGKLARIDCISPIELQVLDCSGKLVFRRKLETGINTIDLGQLGNGLYIFASGGTSRKIAVN